MHSDNLVFVICPVCQFLFQSGTEVPDIEIRCILQVLCQMGLAGTIRMERFHFAAFADYIAKRFQGELVSAETDRDHMHLLVSLTPNTNLSVFVRSIKTQISREMRSKYPDKIGKYLYGKDTPFWSESYFVATTGTVSMETVKGYIESQKTEAHQKGAYRKRQFKKL